MIVSWGHGCFGKELIFGFEFDEAQSRTVFVKLESQIFTAPTKLNGLVLTLVIAFGTNGALHFDTIRQFIILGDGDFDLLTETTATDLAVARIDSHFGARQRIGYGLLDLVKAGRSQIVKSAKVRSSASERWASSRNSGLLTS